MHLKAAVFVTLAVALLMALLPMPSWTVWLRPAWVLLVLIYWTIALPYQIGVGTAWMMGLVVDVLTGSLLGEHALALTLVIYLVSRIYHRFRAAPLLQQGISIMLFVWLYQFIIYCIQGFIGDVPMHLLYWSQAVTSMMLWPLMLILMKNWQKWFALAV